MAEAIHLEKSIKATVNDVFRAFGQSKSLKAWYDPRCRINRFSVGGRLTGDNYPSAEIIAIVPRQTVVHRYSSIVTGMGIWSFVKKRGGKSTLLIFDHLDAYETKEDRDSITFYWMGLIENLAAFCESRQLPFDHDAGDSKASSKRQR